MKSKIQISVTEEVSPCILVEYEESDDVRDLLVKKFKESFQGVSSLAQVEFFGNQLRITPVAPEELKEQLEHLKQVVDAYEDLERVPVKKFKCGDFVEFTFDNPISVNKRLVRKVCGTIIEEWGTNEGFAIIRLDPVFKHYDNIRIHKSKIYHLSSRESFLKSINFITTNETSSVSSTGGANTTVTYSSGPKTNT